MNLFRWRNKFSFYSSPFESQKQQVARGADSRRFPGQSGLLDSVFWLWQGGCTGVCVRLPLLQKNYFFQSKLLSEVPHAFIGKTFSYVYHVCSTLTQILRGGCETQL